MFLRWTHTRYSNKGNNAFLMNTVARAPKSPTPSRQVILKPPTSELPDKRFAWNETRISISRPTRSRMANSTMGFAFAFGPRQSYFLASRNTSLLQGLPAPIATAWYSGDVAEVKCISLGLANDHYFYSYLDKRGQTRFELGNAVTTELRNWLFDKPEAKVVFGFKCGEYVAWNGEECLMSENISPSLRNHLEHMLSGSKWLSGPPKFLALGHNSAWVLITSHNNAYWNVTTHFKYLNAALVEWTLSGRLRDLQVRDSMVSSEYT